MDTKEQEVREAVKFYQDWKDGEVRDSKLIDVHIHTLLSLAQDYLGIEGWPEARECKNGDCNNCSENCGTYLDGRREILHLCKLALLKSVEVEKLAFVMSKTYNSMCTCSDCGHIRSKAQALHDSICGKEKG